MGKNIAILDLAKRPAEVTHINTRMEQSPGSIALLFGSKAIPEGKKSQKDLDLGVTASKSSAPTPAAAEVH